MTMRIKNVVLPNKAPQDRYDVEISHNQLRSATTSTNPTSSPPSLLLPALCHPHIHLDKAYLLTSHPKLSHDDYPDYSDLGLKQGDFTEALSKTSQAKTRYTLPDLILRGSQVVAESVQAGVTSMRAFVEVDHVTQFKCLDAAVHLKQKFKDVCYIQICAFAQDPVMSQEHGEENRQLMEQALDKYCDHIEVLGTTPYVELNTDYGEQNIKWAIEKAVEKNLHLDFHIDYNVSSNSQPLVFEALRMLKETNWADKTKKRIVFGHCTRITVFVDWQMQQLVDKCAGLPVAFVGLPTSDLFMMGRPEDGDEQSWWRERGTMLVVDMIQNYGLEACIGINNVGNSFTPWGNADPLRLASLGVGLYQAGTAEQARTLYECVSSRARRAIGLQKYNGKKDGNDDFDLGDFDGGGILVIRNEESIRCPGVEEVIPARQRLTVTDVVWDPPEYHLRSIVQGQR